MGPRHSLRLALACLLLLPAAVLCAIPGVFSPDFEIQSWNLESGLSGDSVSVIAQTREGFLWVGTDRGLARFDGWTFTRVSCLPPTNTPAADLLKITAECVDQHNTLWFGTEAHGLYSLDPGSSLPIRATHRGLSQERVNCMGTDTNGVVWIGTQSGLIKLIDGVFSKVEIEPGISNMPVLGLQVTRFNGIWITTAAGLKRIPDGSFGTPARPGGNTGSGAQDTTQGPAMPNLDGFRGVFEDRSGSLWCFGGTYLLNFSENRRFNYFRGGGATPLQVWSICEGKPGELWIGTSGQGLFHFGGSRFYAVDLREARDHTYVRAVFVDRDRQIWVGTQAGLVRLREPIVRWFGVNSGVATSLTQDTDGRIWAAFEHAGLYSGRGDILEPAAETVPMGGQNLISSIYIRPDSSFWMGTYGNGVFRSREVSVQRFSTAHNLSDDTILAVCGGMGGRVWVSTSDGKVHRFLEQLIASFDRSHGLTGNPLTAMIRASDGGLWVGTSKGEVLRFIDDRFTQIPQPAAFKGAAVLALREDARKSLWVGTRDGGLGRFHDGAWQIWTLADGLPDSTVTGIEESMKGEMWIATLRGVSKLPAAWANLAPLGEAQRIGERGLPMLVSFPRQRANPSAFGFPRSVRARDGRMWFATDSGVVSFVPAELERSAGTTPVKIELVRANGASIPMGSKSGKGDLTLPSGLREVQLEFGAPRLAYPERIRFRHILEGFDPYWVDSSETRKAQYGKLPAGHYTFRVQCSDFESRWTQPEAVLEIVVPAPFWRTPWGIAVQTLLLAVLVAAVVRGVSHRRLRRQLERAEQQRAMEKERSRIAQDMHDELGAKLTKISFLSERARNDITKPAETAGTTAKLESIASTSRELLQSLDEIVWAVNPHNDSLESLAAYFGQYSSEYFQNTAVAFDLRMPGPLPHAPLTAEVRHDLFLAFEESLGNSLRHSGATRVKVAMALEGERFRIVVSDNGRGLARPGETQANSGNGGKARAGRGGTGLRGMEERMKKSGGTFEVKGAPGEGTEITLSIPVTQKEQL